MYSLKPVGHNQFYVFLDGLLCEFIIARITVDGWRRVFGDLPETSPTVQTILRTIDETFTKYGRVGFGFQYDNIKTALENIGVAYYDPRYDSLRDLYPEQFLPPNSQTVSAP